MVKVEFTLCFLLSDRSVMSSQDSVSHQTKARVKGCPVMEVKDGSVIIQTPSTKTSRRAGSDVSELVE